MQFIGRKKPYTEIGIGRIPCRRCGKPSTFQWNCCANGNRYMGICFDCDMELNKIVVEFFKLPKQLLKDYIKRQTALWKTS